MDFVCCEEVEAIGVAFTDSVVAIVNDAEDSAGSLVAYFRCDLPNRTLGAGFLTSFFLSTGARSIFRFFGSSSYNPCQKYMLQYQGHLTLLLAVGLNGRFSVCSSLSFFLRSASSFIFRSSSIVLAFSSSAFR